jgi:2-polyprenyl-3-methyl-5-hydroxy-6-metoxy-1,4-benzoquinol methylase
MRTRSLEPELLDRETPPLGEREQVAGYLAFVNRWLGGTDAVAWHLKRHYGSATVLDVAAGAGDMTRDLAERFPLLRFPFRDRSVDFIITTHFFHHLSDEQIVHVLREFDRVAKRGIVVNDLLRNRRAILWIKLLTLWANRWVKADGPQSVRKAFKIREIEALAAQAGVGWLKARKHFGHRFTLAGVRPENG